MPVQIEPREVLQDLLRQAASKSLFYFTKDILGYPDLHPQPHAEMCEFLKRAVSGIGTSGQTAALLLVPRTTFKTTIGSVSLSMWLLKDNPNLRILISSHSTEYSKQILDEIKFNAVFCDEFKSLYGNWTSGASQWSDEAITLARSVAHHEPTIDTTGVEKTKTGGHYDLIIADDLHDEKNVDTEGQRAKVKRHLQTLWPILEPGGALLVIGTRWHAADVYGMILSQEKERKERMGDDYIPQWSSLVRSSHLEDGRLYFPSRLTEEFLNQQKDVLEPRYYAVWYENRPLSEESLTFPESWWRFFDGQFQAEPLPILRLPRNIQTPLYVTMAIDPAMSKSNRSDFTAITIVGTSPENFWFVLEAKRIRGGPVAVLPYAAHCIRQYQPQILSIESTGFQELWKIWLLERLDKLGLHVGIREYTEATRVKKAFRITAMQPLFKRGHVFLRRGLNDLYEELRDFPEPAHDDLLDSLAQHLKIARPAKMASTLEELLPPWKPPGQEEPLGRGLNVGLATQKLERQ